MIISPALSDTEVRVLIKINEIAADLIRTVMDQHIGDSFPEVGACSECRVYAEALKEMEDGLDSLRQRS